MNYRKFVPGALVAAILTGCNTSSTPPTATVSLVGPDGKAIAFPTPAPVPTPFPIPSVTTVNSYGFNASIANPGTIRGRVIDANGNPVPSAKVFIAGKESSTAVTAAADGTFTITGITENSVTLMYSAPGYTPLASFLLTFPNVLAPVISTTLAFGTVASVTGISAGTTATNFGSSGNSNTAPIAVTFARAIDPSSIGSVTATLVGFTTAALPATGQALSIKAELSANNTTLTITPLNAQNQATTWGPATDHTVVRFNLSGLRDTSGNPEFVSGSNSVPGFQTNGVFELGFTNGQAIPTAPTWPASQTLRMQSVTNIQSDTTPFVGSASTAGTLNTISFSQGVRTPAVDYNTSAATLAFTSADTPTNNEIIGYKLFVTTGGNSADFTGSLTSGTLTTDIVGGTVAYGPSSTSAGGQLILPPPSGAVRTVGLNLSMLPSILNITGTSVWGTNSYVFQLFAVDKYGRIVGGTPSGAFADTTPPVVNPNLANSSFPGMRWSSIWAGNAGAVTAPTNLQQGQCRVLAAPTTTTPWDMTSCTQLQGTPNLGLVGQINSLVTNPPPPGLWMNMTEPLDKTEAEKTSNFLWVNRLTGDTTPLPTFTASYFDVLASSGSQVVFTATNGAAFPVSVILLAPTTATQTWFTKVKQEIWLNNASATTAGTIKDKVGNVFPAAVPSSGATRNNNAVVALPDLIPPRTILPYVATNPTATPSPQTTTWSYTYVAPTGSAAGSFVINFDEPILVSSLAAGSITLTGVNAPSSAPTTTGGITDTTVASPFPTLTRSATWVIPTGAPSASVTLAMPSPGAFTDAGANVASPLPASPVPISTTTPFGNASGSF